MPSGSVKGVWMIPMGFSLIIFLYAFVVRSLCHASWVVVAWAGRGGRGGDAEIVEDF